MIFVFQEIDGDKEVDRLEREPADVGEPECSAMWRPYHFRKVFSVVHTGGSTGTEDMEPSLPPVANPEYGPVDLAAGVHSESVQDVLHVAAKGFVEERRLRKGKRLQNGGQTLSPIFEF